MKACSVVFLHREEHSTKRRIDLLILNSNETITVESSDSQDLGIIDEGGVAIDDGIILETGSSQLLERKYSSNHQVSADGEVILPGFVDPHSHLVFNGSREDEFQQRQAGASYLEILKRGGGIMETVAKTRESLQADLVSVSKPRIDTILESGTTTVEIKSGYGLQVYDELKILRAIKELRQRNSCRIVPTFLGAHALPPYASQREYSRLVTQEMLPVVSRQKLADFCDVFSEDGAFDANASRRILNAGRSLGLRSKIHADQFTDSGGAKVANDLAAVSADHLVHSRASELERMRDTRVVPVVLPASSESLLANEFAPARAMIADDLPVALGSDFSPSNWVLGLLTVGAIAARHLRMRSEEIVRAITLNAARALGLDHRIGSLDRGKIADIAILKVPSYKRIGYTYGEGVVDKVLIAGRQVVGNGKRVT